MVVHKSCAFGVVQYVLRVFLLLQYYCTTTVVDVLYRYTLSFYPPHPPVVVPLCTGAQQRQSQVCCRRYYLQQYALYERVRHFEVTRVLVNAN